MKKISGEKFKEKPELVLEWAATGNDSFTIETELGNAVLISEEEYKSYMKIMDSCFESLKIISRQRKDEFS